MGRRNIKEGECEGRFPGSNGIVTMARSTFISLIFKRSPETTASSSRKKNKKNRVGGGFSARGGFRHYDYWTDTRHSLGGGVDSP